MQVVVNDIPRTKGNVIVKVNGVDRECEKVQLNDGTVIWEIPNEETVTFYVTPSYTALKPSGDKTADTNNKRKSYLAGADGYHLSVPLPPNIIPVGAVIDNISWEHLSTEDLLAFILSYSSFNVNVNTARAKGSTVDNVTLSWNGAAWVADIQLNAESSDDSNAWDTLERIASNVGTTVFTNSQYQSTTTAHLNVKLTVTYHL